MHHTPYPAGKIAAMSMPERVRLARELMLALQLDPVDRIGYIGRALEVILGDHLPTIDPIPVREWPNDTPTDSEALARVARPELVQMLKFARDCLAALAHTPTADTRSYADRAWRLTDELVRDPGPVSETWTQLARPFAHELEAAADAQQLKELSATRA